MIVMRYRIKKYTKLDGSEYFNAQVKKWCPVWDYKAPNYQFTITFKTRTNVEFTTEPQMGYSTC